MSHLVLCRLNVGSLTRKLPKNDMRTNMSIGASCMSSM